MDRDDDDRNTYDICRACSMNGLEMAVDQVWFGNKSSEHDEWCCAKGQLKASEWIECYPGAVYEDFPDDYKCCSCGEKMGANDYELPRKAWEND
tara:strand:- start:565 stop:846 length:282 start_codon:yes stop_codon:yes gene_type:complete